MQIFKFNKYEILQRVTFSSRSCYLNFSSKCDLWELLISADNTRDMSGVKTVDYFRKKFQHRCFTGCWINLWKLFKKTLFLCSFLRVLRRVWYNFLWWISSIYNILEILEMEVPKTLITLHHQIATDLL